MIKNIFTLVFACFLTFSYAQTDENQLDISQEELQLLLKQDSIVKSFKYQTGIVVIGDNLATLTIPDGWLYLEPQYSRTLMEDIYKNEPNPKSLGILLPDTVSVIEGVKWLVEYNYNDEGHVKDDDAKEIDYDELAKELKKSTEEGNSERIKNGYSSIGFIGWAQKPFYDEINKKLHWAKELEFDKNPSHTLNYEIRVLGRKGFLEMLIISDMENLNAVKTDVNKILSCTNFNDGNKYADYNSDVDKLAEYGLGGLIAGGILLKTGVFAKIGIFLLKFIKIIIVGVVALGAFISKKFFKKKEEAPATEENPE